MRRRIALILATLLVTFAGLIGGLVIAYSAEPARAPELEALLPTSVAGVSLTINSADHRNLLPFIANERSLITDDTVLGWLEAHGKSYADVSYAAAHLPTGEGIQLFLPSTVVIATRIKGLSGDEVRQWVEMQPPFTGASGTPAVIGSHEVMRFDDPLDDHYSWVSGDTAFHAYGDTELTKAAISATP